MNVLKSTQIRAEVLIVDDNPGNLQILRENLARWLVASVEAENGAMALNLYQKNRFTMIFPSLEMPTPNGTRVAQAIRRLENNARLSGDTTTHTRKRIPIIAVSAHDDYDAKITALAAGFDDYLTKPVDPDKLRVIMQRWLTAEPPLPMSLCKETEAIVDRKQALVYSNNHPLLAKDMMVMLITMIEKEKDSMLSLYREKDWKNLGYLVHKLCGGSCYCGVPELYRQCQLIDEAIQKRAFAIVEHSFMDLIRAMDELLQWNRENNLDVIFGD